MEFIQKGYNSHISVCKCVSTIHTRKFLKKCSYFFKLSQVLATRYVFLLYVEFCDII